MSYNNLIPQSVVLNTTSVSQIKGLLQTAIQQKEISPTMGSTLIRMLDVAAVTPSGNGGSTVNLLPLTVGPSTQNNPNVAYVMNVNGFYGFETNYDLKKKAEFGSYYDPQNANGTLPIHYLGVRNGNFDSCFNEEFLGSTDSYAMFVANYEENSGNEEPSIKVVSSVDSPSGTKYYNELNFHSEGGHLKRTTNNGNTSCGFYLNPDDTVSINSLNNNVSQKMVQVNVNSDSFAVVSYYDINNNTVIFTTALAKELTSNQVIPNSTLKLPVATSNVDAVTRLGINVMYLDETTGVIKTSCPVYASDAAASADLNMPMFGNYFNSTINKYRIKTQ